MVAERIETQPSGYRITLGDRDTLGDATAFAGLLAEEHGGQEGRESASRYAGELRTRWRWYAGRYLPALDSKAKQHMTQPDSTKLELAAEEEQDRRNALADGSHVRLVPSERLVWPKSHSANASEDN